MNGPVKNSYCVVKDHVYAGEFPGSLDLDESSARLESFLAFGINCFIDLTEGVPEPGKAAPYQSLLSQVASELGVQVEHHNLIIEDLSIPSLSGMKEIQDLIESQVSLGNKVYIHCWGGVGRTGTTVGCYLCRGSKNGDEALAKTQVFFETMPKEKVGERKSPQNKEQRDFVRLWAKQ